VYLFEYKSIKYIEQLQCKL